MPYWNMQKVTAVVPLIKKQTKNNNNNNLMVWRFDPSVVFLKACKKDSAGRNVWPLTIVCIYTIEPFGWQAVCNS